MAHVDNPQYVQKLKAYCCSCIPIQLCVHYSCPDSGETYFALFNAVHYCDGEGTAAVRYSGDLIVAGNNFGCGSSREYAPLALRLAGVGAIVAPLFARIFFRNAINIGFPAVEAETDGILAGDRLRLDLSAGAIENLTRGTTLACRPYPAVMLAILRDGGLVAHLKKHGTYRLG